ncbi:cobalamin 5 -phosphate synthase, partial [Nannochloropsis gaditana CCMP526]
AAAASTLAGVWITGAFHEDGLADSLDAFGGGWGRLQILRIMTDTR